MKKQTFIPSKLTTAEKFKLGIFRKILMPMVEWLGGQGYKGDMVNELVYGYLPDEKFDYITPNKKLSAKIAIFTFMVVAGLQALKEDYFGSPFLNSRMLATQYSA